MNKVILMGRITHDLELKQTASGTAYCQFSIAVNRRFAKDGQQTTDFINCVSFSKTAEFVCKYFHKGSMIAVVGQLQSNSYEKDGKKYTSHNVLADEVYFTGEKNEKKDEFSSAGFDDIPDEEDLPF